MILSTLLAATMMLADTTPAAATAATTAATSAPAAAPAKKPEGKLVCRSEPVTGSMMAKKTCYRVEDRAQEQQEQRQNLQKIQQPGG